MARGFYRETCTTRCSRAQLAAAGGPFAAPPLPKQLARGKVTVA
jgi:hypothetical protein